MADTAATDIPAETDTGDEPALTLAQAEELLPVLGELEDRFPWLSPLAAEFRWAIRIASESGTICECGFTIVPPEKT
jgi:hypothetical protein